MTLQLVDFSLCSDSNRNGSYAGNAGSKRGIIFNGANWIVKYPKTTRSMRGDKLPSYTSSPLSEFLGSQVYAALGVPVHETVLGTDRGKTVVACRDFRPDNGILKEFRALKNAMTPELNDLFDAEIAESATGDHVNLDETLFHLERNPILDIPGIRERLFEMMVVDAIIDNPDRNNGNWGILTVEGENELAPVYDNGNAFSAKVDDDHLDVDPESITRAWAGGRTIYEHEGHQLSNKKLFSLDLPGLQPGLTVAMRRMLSAYAGARDDIMRLVDEIPDSVCSERRKLAYKTGMDARATWLADDVDLAL